MKTRYISLSRFLGLLIVISILFTVKPALGGRVAKLPKVMNPFFITISDGRLYIVENSVAAHIYTLGVKDVTFVKTFGREGQGPGEFDFMYLIRPYKDHLEIPGSHKLARFSLEGEYIDEVKVPIGMFKGGIFRLGENYLIKDYQFDATVVIATIRLYDKNFKLIREIGARKEAGGIEKINLVADYYSPRVAGDRIFVIASGKESIVTSYDWNGIRQSEIRLPLGPLKITAALKEAIIKPLKENNELRQRWNEFEKRLYFPDQTPGLDYFDVVDGKFVARTYKYRQNLVEFVSSTRTGGNCKGYSFLIPGVSLMASSFVFIKAAITIFGRTSRKRPGSCIPKMSGCWISPCASDSMATRRCLEIARSF